MTQKKLRAKYKDLYDYKYILDEDYVQKLHLDDTNETITPPKGEILAAEGRIHLNQEGVLTLKKGFAWNGANVVPDWDSILRGSLVHDALYQLLEEGILPQSYRKLADRLLAQMCVEDGMSAPGSWCVYLGVRLCGKGAAKRKRVKRPPNRPPKDCPPYK